MTNQVTRKLKPTGGIKVDHASANRELQHDLESKARAGIEGQSQSMDAIEDTDLADVLGEIEGLVEQVAIAEEVAVVAEDDVDAQLEAALDGVLEELPPDEEAAVEDGGTGVAEDSAAGELGDDADEDDAPTEVTGAEAPVDMTEPQLEADEAAAADGDDDHLPAEVAAAAAAVSKPSQGDSGDGEDTARTDAPADVYSNPTAEDGDEVQAQALPEAAEAETIGPAPAGPLSLKAASAKPAGISVPKAPAIAAGLAGRKGLLPPVRKTGTAAAAAPAAAGKAGASAKPAIGCTAVKATLTAKGAASVKPDAISKPTTVGAAKPAVPTKPAPAAAAKPVAAKPAAASVAKPAATAATAAKPAAVCVAKPVATAATAAKPAAVSVAKPAATAATAAKPAAASLAKPAAATIAAVMPAAALAAKAVATGAAKSVAAGAKTAAAATPAAAVAKPAASAVPHKPKAAPAPKVIQARIIQEDEEAVEALAEMEHPKTKALAAPPAKAAKKAAEKSTSVVSGGGSCKRGAAVNAAAAAAAVSKRVVTVGSKTSVAYEIFKLHHKEQLIAQGMKADEAAAQTVKAWATLCAEDKAEYEAQAKEQTEGNRGQPAACLRKTQEPHKVTKTAKTSPAEAGPKFYNNGYMLFLEEHRAGIVAENPNASFVEIGKLLGAEWRGLGKDGQEDFNNRSKALNEESGAQRKPRRTKKDDGGSKPQASNVVVAGTAATKKGGVSKLGGKSTKMSSNGLHRLAEVAHDSTEVDDGGTVVDDIGDAGGKRTGGNSRKRSSGGSHKRRRSSAADCQAAAADDEAPVAAVEDSGDDSEREDVDWESHPAEAILAKTSDGRYLVKRVGLGLDEYGIVNARAVKRQRLLASELQAEGEEGDAEESAATLPVSIEMVDEFEAFERAFWSSIQDRSEGGDLDLDNLGENSPLELCYYLGKLRENRMALHPASIGRRDKDTMIRVPALRLSMAVQRVLTVERQRAEDLTIRLAEVQARLARYEGDDIREEAAADGAIDEEMEA